MKSDYKVDLNKSIQKKRLELSTTFSEEILASIFSTLEFTPRYLSSLAEKFDNKNSLKPLIKGKRSFRETLIHLLNFEGLNYTTVYPAYLLNKPQIYLIHAERDFDRLNLFHNFQLQELLYAFCLERKKYLNFLQSINKKDWNRQMIEEGKAREETIYTMARRTAIHDFTHKQILQFQTNFYLIENELAE